MVYAYRVISLEPNVTHKDGHHGPALILRRNIPNYGRRYTNS